VNYVDSLNYKLIKEMKIGNTTCRILDNGRMAKTPEEIKKAHAEVTKVAWKIFDYMVRNGEDYRFLLTVDGSVPNEPSNSDIGKK
jgi:hypothetical protein